MAELLRFSSALAYVLLAMLSNVSLSVARSQRFDYQNCVSVPHDMSVRLDTVSGSIDIELYGHRAPITTCNFLRYVTGGWYDGGKFFRTVRPQNQRDGVAQINVVQADIREGVERPFPPIPMERTNQTGIHHTDGTISMARGSMDDADSSFFIVIGLQPELDFGGKRQPDGQGFAAFGRVIHGMAVVRRIWMAPALEQNLTPPIGIKHAYLLDDRRLDRP